jgi:hypothetical protein
MNLRIKLEEEAAAYTLTLGEVQQEHREFQKKRRKLLKDQNELDAYRNELAARREMEQNDIAEFKKEYTSLKNDQTKYQKKSDADAKAVMDLIRERDMLTKGVRESDWDYIRILWLNEEKEDWDF